ncbi:MAG: hypothetical protein QXW98_06080 [Candidatus Caldarchaeum sp.]
MALHSQQPPHHHVLVHDISVDVDGVRFVITQGSRGLVLRLPDGTEHPLYENRVGEAVDYWISGVGGRQPTKAMTLLYGNVIVWTHGISRWYHS